MKKVIAFSLLLSILLSLCGTAVYAENGSTDIDEILNNMTTEEKVAQTLMMDFTYWYGEQMTVLPDDLGAAIAGYGFGGVILFAANLSSAQQTLELTDALQSVMSEKGRVPLLIATDQEGGSITRLSYGTNMTGNMALAATGSSENARTAGEIIGSELAAVGINTCLAPALDIQSDANNTVMGLRSFADTPLTVVEYGMAFASGLTKSGVISCAKHYPGHGNTSSDSHYSLPSVEGDYETLMQTQFPPFAAAASGGMDMIMTAHVVFPGIDDTKLYSYKTGLLEARPATLSQKLITEILKGELGFDGVVITDAMNMQGITNKFSEVQAVIEALCAGADMICMPCAGINNIGSFSRVDDIIFGVKDAVESGYLPAERLDDAVRRILQLKAKKGLLVSAEQGGDISVVASEEHTALEREIAAKAVTVIENDGILPLKAEENEVILVFCPASNQAAQIVMGANRAKEAGLFPESTELMVYTFSESDYFVQGYLQSCIDRADKVIALSQCTGTEAMAFRDWRTAGVANIVNYCAAAGKPSVVVSVELPYDVQLYPKANAVIAVYGATGSSLDVTQAFITDAAYQTGSGPNIIAGMEVIFGIFSAQGKLPVNVPAFSSTTLSFTEEIIYPRGWGQSYRAFKHY